MSVPSYSFYSLSLKLPNKGVGFLFPPLKLPNKRSDEYSKIIIFIHFHSILVSQIILKFMLVGNTFLINHFSQIQQMWELCARSMTYSFSYFPLVILALAPTM